MTRPESVQSPFVTRPDLNILNHRPHKSALLLARALTATALFRIWPMLLFMGGWAAMVVLINKKTDVDLAVSSVMLTVWGVLLGLTLTYRTNSGYERYWEGRRMWSQIILAARTWARIVWVHYSRQVTPIDDPEAKELDRSRTVIEKKTAIDMALAFAVAVKHYLRGEEGIYYEDLYDLVKHIPSLHFPSGIPTAADVSINPGLSRYQVHEYEQKHPYPPRGSTSQTSGVSSAVATEATTARSDSPIKSPSDQLSLPPRPILRPAEDPPVFRWSETFPIRFLVSRRQRLKIEGRRAMRERMKDMRESGGPGSNVPLEITLFMSNYMAALQARKVIDVPTTNALLGAIMSFGDCLSSLERILTTPIPWSYRAHIWEVAVAYCLLLPFQLYTSFGWNTIPATMITSYIIIGFAAIGEEIENPFGYDANDLNLDFFVGSIIRPELAAITARPFTPTTDWMFTPRNTTVGGIGADKLQYMGMDRVRKGMESARSERGDYFSQQIASSGNKGPA